MKRPKIFKKREVKPKCTYESHPTWYGKVWHFLAHEESWASYLVDAILIILIGKFLIYPAIGFALGTSYPVVAVVSDSMDHHDLGFEAWWAQNGEWYEGHNLTKEQFKSFYKADGFKKGDVFVVKGVEPEEFKVGDIVIYRVAGKQHPIIHRVIGVREKNNRILLSTKGDANPEQISFEVAVDAELVEGKAISWAPKIGWVKVALVELTEAFRR